VMPRTILKNLQTRQHCAVGFTLLVRQWLESLVHAIC
jgi:hypothetical protein